jgi:hypothetical protein
VARCPGSEKNAVMAIHSQALRRYCSAADIQPPLCGRNAPSTQSSTVFFDNRTMP